MRWRAGAVTLYRRASSSPREIATYASRRLTSSAPSCSVSACTSTRAAVCPWALWLSGVARSRDGDERQVQRDPAAGIELESALRHSATRWMVPRARDSPRAVVGMARSAARDRPCENSRSPVDTPRLPSTAEGRAARAHRCVTRRLTIALRGRYRSARPYRRSNRGFGLPLV